MNCCFRSHARHQNVRAFTLVELMVSMVVLLIMMVAILAATDQLSRVWRMSEAKMEMFREARAAYFTMTQRMRQATLNISYEYYDAANERRTEDNSETFVPARYGRYSSLHFISGPTKDLLPDVTNGSGDAVFFTAPLGYVKEKAEFGKLSNLVGGVGFYVEYSEEPALPSFLPVAEEKWRWRLKQFLEPSEQSVVQASGWSANPREWFQSYFTNGTSADYVRDMAANIPLLLVLPMLPEAEDRGSAIAPDYLYDSRTDRSFTTTPLAGAGYTGSTIHQLPPLLRVVMLSVDEKSFARLYPENSSVPPEMIPDGLFEDAAELDADLETLNTELSSLNGLSYRIFDTKIALQGAKWSKEQ